MTEILTIVARFEAVPGKADELEKNMHILVNDTRQEEGCIRYDLHRGTENPDLFVFVEEWATRALWEAHNNGEAVRSFRERIGDGMFAQREIMQLRLSA